MCLAGLMWRPEWNHMLRIWKQFLFGVAALAGTSLLLGFSLLGPGGAEGNPAKQWQLPAGNDGWDVGYNLPGDIGAPLDPIESLDVRFDAPGSGVEPPGGGEPSESMIVRTDADGIAEVGAWILGTTPGSYELEVVVPGLADLVLTATALTGPPALVTRVSGDGQRGTAGAPLPEPRAVR